MHKLEIHIAVLKALKIKLVNLYHYQKDIQ